MANHPNFLEIEHKYLLGEGFDRTAFRARMLELEPQNTSRVDVRDVYYLLEGQARHVFRHRYDEELQHLSVKSRQDDPAVRLEVNLDLGQHRGDQQAAVEAFLEVFGVRWRGEIQKSIEVFYFADCEAVYYEARGGGREARCVEFEALETGDLDAALAILERYAAHAGLDSARREKRALVEILHPEIFALSAESP